jgi:hypothetical protein
MTGIAWTEHVSRPQAKTGAKARCGPSSAVVPNVHRITASTTIFLYTKDRTATVLETVDQ